MTQFEIYPGAAFVENISEILSLANKISAETNSTIVFFNAEKMAGFDHVRSAVEHAARSFACGKNISRSLSMEMLLYASAQRQCSVAPEFGLHEGINHMFVVIASGDVLRAKELLREFVAEAEMPVMATVETLMELYGIREEELLIVGEERIEELVVERVALVDVGK